MLRVLEKIVEPSIIYTGSTFKLKVKVDDYYLEKRKLITEAGMTILTEDGKEIRTEWGE